MTFDEICAKAAPVEHVKPTVRGDDVFHNTRQRDKDIALGVLEMVNAKITEMIEDARSEIATDTGLTDEERTQGECTIYDLTALGAWIEDRMEEITQCLT